MDNKQLIIICAVILIASCIICAGVYFGLTNQNNNQNNTTANNTTNNTNNTNVTVEKIANNTDKNSKNSGDEYVYSKQKGDYVKASGQYETDSRGHGIYSYQGSDGVLYEQYYDSNGNPISSEEHYK